MNVAQIVAKTLQAKAEPLLPGAGMIVNGISKAVRSGMRLSASEAANMANTQIDGAQRFWDVELEQAVEYLAENFPLGSGYGGASKDAWAVAVRNNFTGRVVPIIACRPGYEIDDLTRACLVEGWRTTTPPAPAPPAIHAPPPVKAGTPWLIIGAGALVGLLFLRK